MLFVPQRSHDPEMMDRPGHSAADLRCALGDLRSVNRFLGGRRALRLALRGHLTSTPRHATLELLDVGTGGADLPVEMVRYARRLGRRLRVTAIDRDPTTAAIAAEQTAAHRQIRILCADAFHLPFPAGSFDIVTASLFLHHFRHGEIVRLLRALRAMARRAVLINDLRRHRAPWGFMHVAARATRRHAMVVHDGPLSVLRGFTRSELERAARESGTRQAVVQRRWPFRLVLELPGGPDQSSPDNDP